MGAACHPFAISWASPEGEGWGIGAPWLPGVYLADLACRSSIQVEGSGSRLEWNRGRWEAIEAPEVGNFGEKY